MAARRRRTIRLTAADIWPEDDAILPREQRLPILRRLLPDDTRSIRERRPDLWPLDRTGERRLDRDLERLGATYDRAERVWRAPPLRAPVTTATRRVLDPERIERMRRDVERGRAPLWTDAAAALAEIDALLDPGALRPEGVRLLVEWMQREGLSVRRAALRLRVSPSALSRWVRGLRRPWGSTAERIAEVSGVPVESWGRMERAALPPSGNARRAG